jgi:hypothetical protein
VLATAESLDTARTAMFMVLALATSGRAELGVRWLGQAFPPMTSTVTRLQRALWLACADGRFGVAGRDILAGRLTEAVAHGDPDAEVAWWSGVVDALADVEKIKRVAERSLPLPLRRKKVMVEPYVAAATIAGLRARLEEVAEAEAARPPAPAGDGGLPELLADLIGEGTEEERPLLLRARILRHAADGGRAVPPEPWDAPVGDPIGVLREDVAREEEPAATMPALRAAKDFIMAVVDRYAEAAVPERPGEITVKTGNYVVPISIVGVGSMDEVDARIEAAWGPQTVGDKLFAKRQIRAEIAQEQARVRAEAERLAARLTARLAELDTLAGRVADDRDKILTILSSMTKRRAV